MLQSCNNTFTWPKFEIRLGNPSTPDIFEYSLPIIIIAFSQNNNNMKAHGKVSYA